MNIYDLITYVQNRFRAKVRFKWTDGTAISILRHPYTGQWVAALMRQWNDDLGQWNERCDLKCGRDCLREPVPPYLSLPFLVTDEHWAGVEFGPGTDRSVVLRLVEQAFANGSRAHGCEIVLDSQAPSRQEASQDTPIDFSLATDDADNDVPEKIRQMQRLFEYGSGTPEQGRNQNFYRQGKFMEDYEDDASWAGHLIRYFPTYHSLNVPQLRGYFAWRTHLRRGDWHPISPSLAYIYLYELLNGIGIASPQDGLDKMLDFEKNYLDSGYGNAAMRANLHRWMLEFAVLNNLPRERAVACADSKLIQLDEALATLLHPSDRADEAVVSALCLLVGKQRLPLLPPRGMHLLAETWRYALPRYQQDGKDLFTVCFGKRRLVAWFPFSNAVYHRETPFPETEYQLNECRSYLFRDGKWHERRFDKLQFNLSFLGVFLTQLDLRLRRLLKTGHYLKAKPCDFWGLPYFEAVLAEEQRQQAEAARPKVDIHLERLTQIREDAIKTRDSLLTAEELEATELPAQTAQPAPADLPVEKRILLMLLHGEDLKDFFKASKLMPSVIADALNETFFEDIGDNIVECDGDRLSLVEDYIEDLKQKLDISI